MARDPSLDELGLGGVAEIPVKRFFTTRERRLPIPVADENDNLSIRDSDEE